MLISYNVRKLSQSLKARLYIVFIIAGSRVFISSLSFNILLTSMSTSGFICFSAFRSLLVSVILFRLLLIITADNAKNSVDDLKDTNFFTQIEVSSTPLRFSRLFPDSLRFDKPVWMSQLPNTRDQFVVLEHRTGKAFRLFLNPDGTYNKESFGDYSDSVSDGPWEGLMCLAFHPEFTRNRRYFLKHETIRKGQRWTVLVERLAHADRSCDSGKPSKGKLRYYPDNIWKQLSKKQVTKANLTNLAVPPDELQRIRQRAWEECNTQEHRNSRLQWTSK